MSAAMKTVECLVVDDHVAVRAGVRLILSSDSGLTMVGEAASGEAAVAMAAKRRPDVILMDIVLGRGMDGYQATRAILESQPEIGVIMFTAYGERHQLAQGLDAGARGYVLKDAHPDEVIRAVKTVAAGGAYVDPSLGSELVTHEAMLQLTRLTDRERDILEMLAGGIPNREIAAKLFLSTETIRTHVRSAMRKLDADTRTQAVALAIREKLIEV
jgi:DNA-binding NarL/FixJ family response regulator